MDKVGADIANDNEVTKALLLVVMRTVKPISGNSRRHIWAIVGGCCPL
jgi:hypothetical protein